MVRMGCEQMKREVSKSDGSGNYVSGRIGQERFVGKEWVRKDSSGKNGSAKILYGKDGSRIGQERLVWD